LMQKWLWKAVECDTILHYAFPMHQKWKVLPVPTVSYKEAKSRAMTYKSEFEIYIRIEAALHISSLLGFNYFFINYGCVVIVCSSVAQTTTQSM
jgi:hypothetical protein